MAVTTARGERRVETLTVLFTDLVGSTDQRVRIGEEAADVLRDRHDRLCRAAIVTNGGTIVKHTGDGVMATFTGASEALAGAIAVQQAIAADNQRQSADGETLTSGSSRPSRRTR